MAEATVTLKLTPEEFRTVRYALDTTAQNLEELVGAAAPSDMKGLRAMQGKIADLKAKL